MDTIAHLEMELWRRVVRRRRRGLRPINFPQGIDAKHGQHDAKLLDECLHVRLLCFRELARRWFIAVVEADAFGILSELHEAMFQVPQVTLIEPVITTGDENGPVLPVFFSVVLTESVGEPFGLADVTACATYSLDIAAKKQVHAVSRCLVA